MTDRPEFHYVALLRAVNLGAVRRFPAADLRRVVGELGGAQVRTHLNTGNVTFVHAEADASRMRSLLEDGFVADRGFEVPTVLLRAADLHQWAIEIAEVRAGREQVESHYVHVLRDPAPQPALQALLQACEEGVFGPDEDVVVRENRVHLLANGAFHASKSARSRLLTPLGPGTARSHRVLTTLAERWGG